MSGGRSAGAPRLYCDLKAPRASTSALSRVRSERVFVVAEKARGGLRTRLGHHYRRLHPVR